MSAPRATTLFGLSLVVLLAATTVQATVVLRIPGIDDRVHAITDVPITGTNFDGVYDFYFHYDTTYDDFQQLHLPGSPIVWTNTAQTGAVVDTLTDLIIAFGDVGSFRTQGMLLS